LTVGIFPKIKWQAVRLHLCWQCQTDTRRGDQLGGPLGRKVAPSLPFAWGCPGSGQGQSPCGWSGSHSKGPPLFIYTRLAAAEPIRSDREHLTLPVKLAS